MSIEPVDFRHLRALDLQESSGSGHRCLKKQLRSILSLSIEEAVGVATADGESVSRAMVFIVFGRPRSRCAHAVNLLGSFRYEVT